MTVALKLRALALALAGAIGVAQATGLPVDAASSSVEVVPAFFGGSLLESVTTSIVNAGYSGVARAAVYATESGLDFYYQFSNDPGSRTGVERFSAFDFSGLDGAALVDVYQTSTPFGIFLEGGAAATYADHTHFGVVGFNFVPGQALALAPGATSYIEIIRTDAHEHTAGNFGLIGGVAANAPAFAPLSVPEPGTGTLMLAGLAVSGLCARRRIACAIANRRLSGSCL